MVKRVSKKKYPFSKEEQYDLEFRNKLLLEENEKLVKELEETNNQLSNFVRYAEKLGEEIIMYKKIINKLT